MLERFRQFWTNLLSPLADFMLRIGIKPDWVTIVGTLGVSGAALWFYPRGEFMVGTFVIAAFAFSDLLDGYMARKSGQSSKWGAFLDSTLDRVADGAIFGGIALWYSGEGDSQTYTALAILCLLMGAVTSYTRARAEGLGMTAKGGIAERADRLVAILTMTGFSGIFGEPLLLEVTLWALAVASTITVIQRMVIVHKQAFGNPMPPAPPVG